MRGSTFSGIINERTSLRNTLVLGSNQALHLKMWQGSCRERETYLSDLIGKFNPSFSCGTNKFYNNVQYNLPIGSGKNLGCMVRIKSPNPPVYIREEKFCEKILFTCSEYVDYLRSYLPRIFVGGKNLNFYPSLPYL